MLSDFPPFATIAVKNLEAVRPFYEGILGFKPIGAAVRGAQSFRVSGAGVVIYESPLAGTNKATAVTWSVGDRLDEIVQALDARHVPFEHYEMPGVTLEGHVHVVGDGEPSRVAWFTDPDGNIHNLNNGSAA
ncbi:MAG TPA: VOC family protein [Caulobacteraceae bacterium]|jgi:catechol 2,3-dioxygenase-like lactoylglutathione lyase family enzyme